MRAEKYVSCDREWILAPQVAGTECPACDCRTWLRRKPRYAPATVLPADPIVRAIQSENVFPLERATASVLGALSTDAAAPALEDTNVQSTQKVRREKTKIATKCKKLELKQKEECLDPPITPPDEVNLIGKLVRTLRKWPTFFSKAFSYNSVLRLHGNAKDHFKTCIMPLLGLG